MMCVYECGLKATYKGGTGTGQGQVEKDLPRGRTGTLAMKTREVRDSVNMERFVRARGTVGVAQKVHVVTGLCKKSACLRDECLSALNSGPRPGEYVQ